MNRPSESVDGGAASGATGRAAPPEPPQRSDPDPAMMRHRVSLNMNVRGMSQSATLAIKDKCRALRQEGRHVYDLGLGQSPFPVPASVVEALRLNAPEKDYLPVRGLPALREAVAEFHNRTEGVDRSPEHVLVGPGSKELMFLLQLVFYGEIVLPTPCWVTYLPQARIIGRTLSFVHSSFESDWKISAERLQEALELTNDEGRPRLLVLNYPSNPVGNTYTVGELIALTQVARRFGLLVLSDEIYGQLQYDGGHVSIARFYPEGTILSSGLSKWCGAGGWRLGTFTFPPHLDWLLNAMAAVASETYTSVSAPIQYAAVQAFKCGVDIQRYLWHARRVLKALGVRCAQTLRSAGIAVRDPVGAFYLFPDFTPLTEPLKARGIRDGATLCHRLLNEAGVAMLPGSSFARSRGELTARMAFVDFDGGAALAASENIPLDQELPGDFLNQYCRNVLEGVARTAEWVAAIK